MRDKIKKIKKLRNRRGNYINYSQYIAESIDKSISYTDYLTQNLYIDTLSYSEYLSEKIKN